MEGVEKRVSLALGTRGSPSPRVLGGKLFLENFFEGSRNALEALSRKIGYLLADMGILTAGI